MKFTFLLLLFFLSINSCWSQRLNTYLAPGKGEIGATFELFIEVRHNQVGNVTFPTIDQLRKSIRSYSSDAIPDIEIKYVDSVFNTDNQFTWIRKFELIPWDTGVIMVRSTPFRFNEMLFEIPTQFFAVETAFNRGNKASPLKDYFMVVDPKSYNPLVFVISIILIIFIIIYYRIIRRRKYKPREFSENDLTIRPIEKVKLELMHLRLTEYWKEDELKRHYALLTKCIKEYLVEVLMSNNSELTTDEVAELFNEHEVPKELIERIIQLLKEADHIKFAKVEVSEKVIRKTLVNAELTLIELDEILNKTLTDA